LAPGTEQIVEKGERIDYDIDIVMEEAFPLPLVKHRYPSCTPQFEEIMVDRHWYPYLTEQARRAMGIGGTDT